jgi:transcriptional regulator with AAA-type ATPase domain
MVESLLFGHEKGAFTDAIKRDGKFVEAHGGTIFLDEVGEIAPAVQVKLLRVLQEREVEPLGGRARAIDVRVVAATNKDLAALMRKGQFRDDLYYRLDVLSIRVPPLRERRADIPPLVEHFLRGAAQPKNLDPDAMAVLSAFAWPGNVRQLQNFVKKLLHTTGGAALSAALIADLLRQSEASAPVEEVAAERSGAVTKPASTRSTLSPQGGLAFGWWRFRKQAAGPGEPRYLTKLATLGSEVKLASITFAGDRARIGREAEQVEICLPTDEISRLHATVIAQDGGFFIEDNASRNHTFVDEQQLAPRELAELATGTVVRLGKEWLGIVVELGSGGLPDAPLVPIMLAAAFVRASGTLDVAIEIRALEALSCADPTPESDSLDKLCRGLVAAGPNAVVEREHVLRAPPAAPKDLTRAELLAAVAAAGGNKRQAARDLGISHTTLWKRLKGG